MLKRAGRSYRRQWQATVQEAYSIRNLLLADEAMEAERRILSLEERVKALESKLSDRKASWRARTHKGFSWIFGRRKSLASPEPSLSSPKCESQPYRAIHFVEGSLLWPQEKAAVLAGLKTETLWAGEKRIGTAYSLGGQPDIRARRLSAAARQRVSR